MDPIITEYLADRESTIEKLIATAESKNDAVLFLLAGSHFCEKGMTDDITISYLRRSLAIKPMAPAAYNAGYVYETRLRQRTSKNAKTDEESMIALYLQSLALGNPKAANQLGWYFMEDNARTFTFGSQQLTAENLLVLAANKGVVQAVNNLINLYQNNPRKRFSARQRKYEITKDTMHLMEAMLDMLNSAYYGAYLKFIRQVSNTGDTSAASFLKTPPGSQPGTCPICDTDGQLLVLQCKHPICVVCLERMMDTVTASYVKCPQCRAEILM